MAIVNLLITRDSDYLRVIKTLVLGRLSIM